MQYYTWNLPWQEQAAYLVSHVPEEAVTTEQWQPGVDKHPLVYDHEFSKWRKLTIDPLDTMGEWSGTAGYIRPSRHPESTRTAPTRPDPDPITIVRARKPEHRDHLLPKLPTGYSNWLDFWYQHKDWTAVAARMDHAYEEWTRNMEHIPPEQVHNEESIWEKFWETFRDFVDSLSDPFSGR